MGGGRTQSSREQFCCCLLLRHRHRRPTTAAAAPPPPPPPHHRHTLPEVIHWPDGDGCSTCYMWLAIYVHYLFHLTSHTFSSKLFSAINTLHPQFRSQKYFAVIILCHQDVYGTSFFCHQWGCQSGVSICLHIKAECHTTPFVHLSGNWGFYQDMSIRASTSNLCIY